MISGVQEIAFCAKGDDRGFLVAIENQHEIPFAIGRVYYIYGTNSGTVRGRHAHMDLRQVLVCVHGSCEVLLDNGKEQQTVRLDNPEKGIYIYGFIWREMMNFSPDCVLLALVDKPYDPADYVYDHTIVREYSKRKEQ